MNTKILVFCVSIVVLVGYMAVFFIIQHSREMAAPRTEPPKDTRFKSTTIHYQDDHGQEVQRERQFEVSTELVPERLMKQLPPPPVASPTTAAAAPSAPEAASAKQ